MMMRSYGTRELWAIREWHALLAVLLFLPFVPGTVRAQAPTRVASHAGARAKARLPVREYFGLRLGMSRDAAHERIERVSRAAGHGREEEEEGGETWTLTDRRFRYVALGFDDLGRLSWYSLFARPGGAHVLLRNLGDLGRARRRGNFIYVWTDSARAGHAGCQIIARSQNPDTLQSLSIVLLPGDARGPGSPADTLP